MRPVSDTFLRSLRYSHVVASEVELLFPSAPTSPVPVPVQGGNVRIDRTAQSRRAGTIEIPWSLKAGADLGVDLRTLTLGGYAIVKRGLRYADGSTELVQLGRLRVESVSWNTLSASASIELADRMAQVRDEPFTEPFACLGRLPATAAGDIVRGVFPSISYLTPFAPPTAIGDVTFSDARTDALSTLEQSYAAETYFDYDGAFVFAQRPQDTDPVVWTVNVGDGGVLLDADENLDRTGIYNGVLVKGQATADLPPVVGLATFDDPTSPIRWGGPFGKVVLIADSTTVTTNADAVATATSLLNLRLRQTRSLELKAAPNPALEAGDTIRVLFPDGRDERHLIDAVVTDLGTTEQQLTTRTMAAPLAAWFAELNLDRSDLDRADRDSRAGLPHDPLDPLFMGHAAWREVQGATVVTP